MTEGYKALEQRIPCKVRNNKHEWYDAELVYVNMDARFPFQARLMQSPENAVGNWEECIVNGRPYKHD